MADFSALIQRIKDAVYENGVQAITGQILQDCLKDVVNTVNVAKQDGIYRVTVTVDNNTGVPSATARMDDDTYTLEFSFHNLKGEKGDKGDKGDTPVLTADSDGVIYSDGVMLTRVIKDTTDALTTRADSDHARAESDHARAETDHTDITRARGDAETAAGEANYASLRANTAADNADAAREAIQSDLAQKQDVIPDLQQIRAGATDTVKYSTQSLTDAQKGQARANIGAADESEVSQLRSEVDGKEDAIYTANSYNSWTDSRYLVTDTGQPNTSSVNSITDYIDVSKYQRIKTIVNQTTTNQSAACVCFYDSQKNYLNAYVGTNVGSTRGYTGVIIDLPDSTHYVRFTLYTDQKSNWYLSGVVFKKDSLNDDVIGAGIQRITPDIMITGKYRGANGVVFNNASLFYTSPIAVNYGDRIIIRNSAIPPSQALVTRVTNNGDVVSVIKYGESSDFSQYNYDIQIDFDGYVSISDLTLRAPLFLIIKADIYSFITERVGGLVDVDNSTRLSALHDNPLAVILRECGYGCLLKTWGFIGDSYASGETPAYDGGTLKYLDCYKWSWGQQFMRIIGSEGYNFSNGGQTAKGWIRNQGVVHDDTYYGGVGGGDWRQAQENLKQGYIISLGINDKSYFGQTYLGATYTLGDVGDDVNVSDYTQNNENTFAGCYAGIIQRLLSVQPKAKIFCLTQFQDTLEEVNDVVREIVALFPNNVFLIDMHDYAFNIVGEQYYMSNGHPSPLGYAYMAYCINTYVDYIIRTRKQKFMDVTLIGSNYSLT